MDTPEDPASRGALPRVMSSAQERLWFLEQLEPGTAFYNATYALRLHGSLQPSLLRDAVRRIVARHEPLRSVFAASGGEPRACLLPIGREDWQLENLSEIPENDRERRLNERLRSEARQPFDLSSDLMLRTRLYRLAPSEHVLLLVMHHIATDGWSTRLLIGELTTLYNAADRGEPAVLPPLAMTYSEFVQWQRNRLQGSRFERDLAYWRRKLAGAPQAVDLPLDRARPPKPAVDGEKVGGTVDAVTLDALQRLAHEENATLYMVLLGVLMVLLQRYSGQEDLCIGTPSAGRMSPESECLVGFFVNMLVLRESVRSSETFRELLRRIRDTSLDAYEHQEMPFDRLVAQLPIERIRNRSPLFQVTLTLRPDAQKAPRFERLTSTCIPVSTNTAKFDLDVFIQVTREGLQLWMTYPTSLFEAETMRQMADRFCFLCRMVAEQPDATIGSVPLEPPDDTFARLEELNRTHATYPRDSTIAEEFRAVAGKTPDATAVRHGRNTLTYRDLDVRSDRLAHALREFGAEPGAAIAVYAGRCPEMITALLGILKAGAGYVCLDPHQPVEWLAGIVASAGCDLIVSSAAAPVPSPLLCGGRREVCVDTIDLGSKRGSACVPDTSSITTPATGLACIMFTSGSSGRPKGVKITHRGVLRLVTGENGMELGRDTRMLQMASPTFDAATFEIWGPLLNGGECVLAAEGIPTVKELGEQLRAYRINTLWLTATWFNAIVDEDAAALVTVRHLFIGGEALSVRHVHQALRELTDTTIINGYGPTEGTTFTCCYRIPRQLDGRARSVPIGRPIPNTKVYVLDDKMRPTACGVPGELYIAGDGLALGYLEKEHESGRFVSAAPPEFRAEERLYRTGDRVRLLPSGDLDFLGRLDRQMKIRGFRVEPKQIEQVLIQHPAVREACVDSRHLTPDGPLALVAYVRLQEGSTFRAGGNLAPDTLKLFVSTKLPTYMVPAAYVPVSEFPRTSTGKIDTAALPDPSGSREDNATDEPPRTYTEKRIAEIWKRLLKTDRVGVHSNFFELGGHSLLAVRLVAQLQSTLGVSLPLAVLFDCPTIASLSARIERIESGGSRSTVVPLCIHEGAHRFFCIPPAGASVYHFSEWIGHMGDNVSFYGIQPLGLEPDEIPHTSVEEMAARYVADMRTVQGSGPYYIGGRCFGAFVAFEIARQLVSQGEEVGLLALIDPTSPPGVPRRARYYMGRIAYFKRRGKLMFAVIRHLRARMNRVRLLWIRGLLGNAPTRRLARVLRVHCRAQEAYRPEPYAGDLVFLGAKQDYHPEDSRALWKQLTTERFDVRLVPGNHRTMTTEPNLPVFIRTLERLILSATRDGRDPDPRPHDT